MLSIVQDYTHKNNKANWLALTKISWLLLSSFLVVLENFVGSTRPSSRSTGPFQDRNKPSETCHRVGVSFDLLVSKGQSHPYDTVRVIY